MRGGEGSREHGLLVSCGGLLLELGKTLKCLWALAQFRLERVGLWSPPAHLIPFPFKQGACVHVPASLSTQQRGVNIPGSLLAAVGTEGKAGGWTRLAGEVGRGGASLAACPHPEGCLPGLFLALTH